MKEKTLYGVEYGGESELGVHLFEPGIKLIKELESLPKGTSVGIDSFPESIESEFPFLTFVVGDQQAETYDVSHMYYRAIKEICEQRGLNLIYLDSGESFRKIAEKTAQAEAKEADLQRDLHEISRTGKEINDEDLRERVEELIKLQAEVEYLSVVERSENIVKNIEKFNPDVIIIPRGMAQLLMSLHSDQAAKVKTYKLELASEGYPGETELIEGEPDPDTELTIDLIKRNYHAATSWRVLPEREGVSYIGTWDTNIRPRGLFEIYVYENGEGLVEDCLGTATIKLERYEGGLIHFVKTYIPDKCSEDAILEPLNYYLSPVDDIKYEGVWKFPDGRPGGKVEMFLGDKFQV